MASSVAAAASTFLGTRLADPAPQNGRIVARFGFGGGKPKAAVPKKVAKTSISSDRPLWFPGAVAPDYLDGAEPLTHDDLEMAVSDRLRTVLRTHQFVHGKVVWSRRSGQVWDTWVAFDDEHRQRHVLRLRGDGINLADPNAHLLGRSYIVAYDTMNPNDSKMLQFVSPPASCVTAQRSRA